jgi:hypothetical protein
MKLRRGSFSHCPNRSILVLRTREGSRWSPEEWLGASCVPSRSSIVPCVPIFYPSSTRVLFPSRVLPPDHKWQPPSSHPLLTTTPNPSLSSLDST